MSSDFTTARVERSWKRL